MISMKQGDPFYSIITNLPVMKHVSVTEKLIQYHNKEELITVLHTGLRGLNFLINKYGADDKDQLAEYKLFKSYLEKCLVETKSLK